MFEPVSYIDFTPALPAAPSATQSAQQALPAVTGSGSITFAAGQPVLPVIASQLTKQSKKASRSEDGLPVEHHTDAIKAFKIAHLVVNQHGTNLRLRSAAYDYTIKPDDVATCQSRGGHTPPKLTCTCGFYAYRSVAELHHYGIIGKYTSKVQGEVILEVDLLGKIIEHDNLHRAARQRIMQVHLPGECSTFGCNNDPDVMVYEVSPGNPGIAYCMTCSLEVLNEIGGDGPLGPSTAKALNAAEIAGMLEIPVCFASKELGW